MRRFRPAVIELEARLVLSTFLEVEPNNTATEFNPVTVPIGSILTTAPTDWLEITGTIDPTADLDRYQFTLAGRTGVFFDIDSRDIGLSTSLDSLLTVFNAVPTQVGTNDNGYDFEGFAVPTTGGEDSAASPDSSLYLELMAGTYQVQVSAQASSSGPYRLRILGDTNFSATVPVFNSLPGSADTLYLDLDGHAATDDWGTYTAAAFNFDGVATEFTPAEQLAIKNIWRTVAEDFSPFIINVSTVEPPSFADGLAHRQVITSSNPSIIGESNGTLGIAYLNSYAAPRPGVDQQVNTAFTFAAQIDDFDSAAGVNSGRIMATALEIGNTTSHEFGHALGLLHYGGSNAIDGALMQTPEEGLNRETWSSGLTHSSEPPQPAFTQHDMAKISNLTNTFGYRPDDHSNSYLNSTKLQTVGATLTGAGIISQPADDLDFFKLEVKTAGLMTVKVDVDEFINNLDAKVQLYDANRVLLTTTDPKATFDASIVRRLSAGTYYIAVGSNGESGEAGQYTVLVTATDPAAYIRKIYDDLLNREPTAQELLRWTGKLQQGTAPIQIVAKIMDSDEYRGVVVTELYKLLGRLPTANELERLVADLRRGVPREQVQINILASTEYFQLPKDDTNASFLERLFRDVQDKTLDDATRARYLQSLAQGVSRASIARRVVTEARSLERVVTSVFNQFLGRDPSASELRTFVAKLQQRLGQTNIITSGSSGLLVEDIIARLLGSDEYFAAAFA